MMSVLFRTLLIALAAGIGPALAQNSGSNVSRAASTIDTTPPGTLNPKPLPPLAHPDAKDTPAKDLFARKLTPFAGPARAIGGYADGCMEGAEQLPITGPTWQVMRLSRDRNWGNPELITFIERLGANAKKVGWNGLLIGDMAQPRGGPMISGHASHQIGLDVDIWLTPMPHHVLSRDEREMDGAVNMVEPERTRCRSQAVDADAHRAAQGGRGRPQGRAHVRQRGDQEGSLRRSRNGPRLARQAAAVVGTRRAFSRPAGLPAR